MKKSKKEIGKCEFCPTGDPYVRCGNSSFKKIGGIIVCPEHIEEVKKRQRTNYSILWEI